MRLIFAIPHYYDPQGGGRHASLSPDPRPRLAALRNCVGALHSLFGAAQYTINIAARSINRANAAIPCECEVLVLTTGGKHLLSEAGLDDSITHVETDAEPKLLGYECAAALRDRIGGYDVYGYLEDDLIIRDPWFFVKLQRFSYEMGDECLLQPNRYEVAPQGAVRKVYIDGDLNPQVTAPFQNVADRPSVSTNLLGVPVEFRRPLNPHAGCYFLNVRQLATWAAQPYFNDRDASFVGPLESAATLGIMRTFRIYKPASHCANLLEIEHFGQQFLNLIHIAPTPPTPPT